MHEFHPETLVGNLELVPKFGYFKDLLEIVLTQLQGEEEKQTLKKSELPAFMNVRRPRHGPSSTKKAYWERKGKAARDAKKDGTLQDRATRIAASLAKDMAESEKAAELRKTVKKEMVSRARTKYTYDANYAKLHDAVAEIFAKQLLADKKSLDDKKLFDISFAAKWAPTAGRSYDRSTLMHDAIARKLFNKEDHPVLADLDDDQYASVVGDKLRKEFLVPLRQALRIPEVYMSANNWGILPYERVPSVAMKNYAEIFLKRDKERYTEFLTKAAKGDKKVAAGALLPHVIAKDAIRHQGSPQGLLAELQWTRMVNDLKENGSQLTSSMAVCDVSGSMSGTPMEVCIALGLLVAELSDEPWKNHLCTFSHDPQIHAILGNSLVERYSFTQRMQWDMNTDFQKVFQRLLELAKASDLPPEKMIKRVFVFSDMEFDQASANPWETDYMIIKRSYEEAGYGEPPEIVFWNLRDSRSTPVLSNQEGVALVSGFSKNLLKVFLDNEPLPDEELQEEDHVQEEEKKKVKAKITPTQVMMKALSGDLFDELKVLD